MVTGSGKAGRSVLKIEGLVIQVHRSRVQQSKAPRVGAPRCVPWPGRHGTVGPAQPMGGNHTTECAVALGALSGSSVGCELGHRFRTPRDSPGPIVPRLGFVTALSLHPEMLSWNAGWGRSCPMLATQFFNSDRPNPRCRFCPPIEGFISCMRPGNLPGRKPRRRSPKTRCLRLIPAALPGFCQKLVPREPRSYLLASQAFAVPQSS